MKKITKNNTLIINEKITQKLIRIIGDINPTDEITKEEALSLSKKYDYDLILVSVTKNNVAICKILDKSKYLYEQKKKQKEQEKKNRQNKIEVKEIRFGPNTDEHDFNFKKNHAESFLKKGDKVKAFVFFKGREMMFKEKGQILLLKLAEQLENVGIPENMPKMEGNKMIMFLKPKK